MPGCRRSPSRRRPHGSPEGEGRCCRREAPDGAAEAAAGGDADPTPPTPRLAAGKRAYVLLAAQAGEMLAAPDFSAPTHAGFRKKLDAVRALAEAVDVEGLRVFAVKPVSSSPKAIACYLDLAITSLEGCANMTAA